LLGGPDGSSRSVAILALEVSDFCDLKTRLGDAWADELLRTIAERLHEAVPEPALMTRLSSGAFAIVLRDLGPEVMPEALATDLLQRASEPCPSPTGGCNGLWSARWPWRAIARKTRSTCSNGRCGHSPAASYGRRPRRGQA
jgi:GGDEF domain-containing protein